MTIIACVDDNFGLIFNNRRVSKDRRVTERIYEITHGRKLYINDFSKELFCDGAVVCDNPLMQADDKDFCFIENIEITDYERITKIILFFWNRAYPSDLKLNLPDFFKEVRRLEFGGNSHDKITEVEYEKIK